MLKFDAETTRTLDLAYQGADITRRRQASFDALAPVPGDVVVDIGCGNGMLTAELARAVGQSGRVIGIDPSADMLVAGQERCAEFAWVEMVEGRVEDMPLGDRTADKAVSLQVFEYLSDIPAALAEARRVLRPGGRLVLGDMHWDCWAWRAEDTERMARMMASWRRHVADQRVPERLPEMMRSAGFEVMAVTPMPMHDTVLKPDGIARMMLVLMENYAVSNGHLTAEEARGWMEEQEALAADGRFFMHLDHFVTSARKL